jgi:hypothetical protein
MESLRGTYPTLKVSRHHVPKARRITFRRHFPVWVALNISDRDLYVRIGAWAWIFFVCPSIASMLQNGNEHNLRERLDDDVWLADFWRQIVARADKRGESLAKVAADYLP